MFALNKTLNFKIIQSWPNFVSLFTLIRKRVYNLFLRHFSRDSSLHGLPHKTRFPASCELQPPHSKTTNLNSKNVSIYMFFQGLLTGTTLIWQVDILDDPVRSMDVNKWKDSHLMDVSESAARTLNVTAVVWSAIRRMKNAYFHSPQPWLSSPSVHSIRRISRDPWWTAAACTPDTFTPWWVTTEIEISRRKKLKTNWDELIDIQMWGVGGGTI